jgi:hypothetical protein
LFNIRLFGEGDHDIQKICRFIEEELAGAMTLVFREQALIAADWSGLLFLRPSMTLSRLTVASVLCETWA